MTYTLTHSMCCLMQAPFICELHVGVCLKVNYTIIMRHYTHFNNMKTVRKPEKCITYALLLSAPQIANASHSAQMHYTFNKDSTVVGGFNKFSLGEIIPIYLHQWCRVPHRQSLSYHYHGQHQLDYHNDRYQLVH